MIELNTILSISIPIIGFFAFMSGYYFGKSDETKKNLTIKNDF
jgi:hypothetical protein